MVVSSIDLTLAITWIVQLRIYFEMSIFVSARAAALIKELVSSPFEFEKSDVLLYTYACFSIAVKVEGTFTTDLNSTNKGPYIPMKRLSDSSGGAISIKMLCDAEVKVLAVLDWKVTIGPTIATIVNVHDMHSGLHEDLVEIALLVRSEGSEQDVAASVVTAANMLVTGCVDTEHECKITHEIIEHVTRIVKFGFADLRVPQSRWSWSNPVGKAIVLQFLEIVKM
jgi:hypothetical protein